ncbi:MAG TPA: metallophosphoesterase [Gemmatimonadales bacterium]|jgi:predicted phosphohydrolase
MQALLRAGDLHLDHAHPAARQTLRTALRELPGKAVILTGDLTVARLLAAELEFIADAAERPVYFVLGNHDHYGSSVARVRDLVADLTARRPEIRWLPPAGVIELGEDLAVVGVDGWADGLAGDPMATPLVLNDDRLIAELAAFASRAGKLVVKRALARADAERLEVLLERAVEAAGRVIVVTHIPPFVESLPRSGRLANPAWHPLLVCGSTGEVLRRIASRNPGHTFSVWCGHTHVATDVAVLPNLRCKVIGARYGEPAVHRVDI